MKRNEDVGELDKSVAGGSLFAGGMHVSERPGEPGTEAQRHFMHGYGRRAPLEEGSAAADVSSLLSSRWHGP